MNVKENTAPGCGKDSSMFSTACQQVRLYPTFLYNISMKQKGRNNKVSSRLLLIDRFDIFSQTIETGPILCIKIFQQSKYLQLF